jgi:glycogen debranching enzyme
VTADPLDALLSDEGWAYASAPPVEPGDPGRFHALFGRDSLITALQVLPARPDVARATLRALAALQGTSHDPDTDEEPGKILHEFRPRAEPRFAELGWPVRDGRLLYYGSADSTSWFLVVLAALGDRRLAAELEPAWRAAAGWLDSALERGGGLVRHGPRTRSGGLAQQGWRDASAPVEAHAKGGGILRPDGRAPTPPLADADVQAVAYAALRALGVLSGGEAWTRRAEGLAARLERDFGPGVMALEGVDLPVPGAGSQLGWLLWSGALSEGPRDALAARLCEPDVLTAYGLRTLSSTSPVFDPQAYHRGSVWPFDSWLGWGGLRAAGRAAEAEAVRAGVLAALDTLGQAPELYAVTPGGELEPAPAANRVQAWTVGARWALEHDWDGRPGWL